MAKRCIDAGDHSNTAQEAAGSAQPKSTNGQVNVSDAIRWRRGSQNMLGSCLAQITASKK